VGYERITELRPLLPGPIRILPKDHYRKVDLKTGNRMKRLKKKRIHDKQTKRRKRARNRL